MAMQTSTRCFIFTQMLLLAAASMNMDDNMTMSDNMTHMSTLNMTGITVCLSNTMHQMGDGMTMMNSDMSATFCKDCNVYPVLPSDCVSTGGVCLNGTYHAMSSGMVMMNVDMNMGDDFCVGCAYYPIPTEVCNAGMTMMTTTNTQIASAASHYFDRAFAAGILAVIAGSW
mmetsp:Transcript_60600/g.112430  ORF Transcript_60600/g.112430 Transcript_60600/m.112430 type:complete len:171 (+) Transcript_60600:85-597(+)